MVNRLAPVTSKEPYKILLIEDVLSWQKTFQRYFKTEPFIVTVAASCQEALRVTEHHKFDLLIIDINLTGVPYNIDGLRIADQIWQEDKSTKIIVVSGIDDPNRRLRTFNFKPICLIEKKNLDQDEFIKIVYQTLRGRDL